MSLFSRRFGIGWWNASGLAAAASAGANELESHNANWVIYDSPKYGVTVVIARGHRAAQLRTAVLANDPRFLSDSAARPGTEEK